MSIRWRGFPAAPCIAGLVLLLEASYWGGDGEAGDPLTHTLPVPGELKTWPENFTNHLRQLRARIPPGFTHVWQPPFFVIGDEPASVVQGRATNTVKWAVDLLRKDFFSRDPEPIVDIWLFRDKDSYEKHAREIFHDTPASRFGYYAPRHRALLMNISTGGGTLVHEIVHPFIEANLPGCPPWYNEGLASLYEAAIERDGRICGQINWRLKVLEKGIEEHRLLGFEKLMSLNETEFYGATSGYSEHYAQARYLCYYLQEQGLLVRFHRMFINGARTDPTGVRTLKRILRTDDLDTFQVKWERFIRNLRRPR